MYPCSNCGAKLDPTHNENLVIEHGGAVVTALCPACVTGTKLIKIVLKRKDDGVFECEQYAALEMINKAFGK
jgi:hypothetical protein